MAESRLWKDLEREVNTLRRQFLPSMFDPLGNYRNRDLTQAQTRAFVVFSHAAIESYLELMAREIAKATERVWIQYSRVSLPLIFLIGAHKIKITVRTKLVGTTFDDAPEELRKEAQRVFRDYYKVINENNGIKEHNVLALFGPLGIPMQALGTTLAPNLDSLGALRGEHAHNSRKAVVSVLDPETEYKAVQNILTELKSLDEWATKYRRAIR